VKLKLTFYSYDMSNLSDELHDIGATSHFGKDNGGFSELANDGRKRDTEFNNETSYVTESSEEEEVKGIPEEGEESESDSDSESEEVSVQSYNLNSEPTGIGATPGKTPIDGIFNRQDERKRKFQMFVKIKELNKKHMIAIPMDVTMNTEIGEVQMVLDTMIDAYRKKHAVESYRKIIVTGTTVVEWMNNKYDPFDFHLKGWSESVFKSVDNSEYDDVFEELHEKYKSDSKMAPEMRLFMLLAGSAFMHHTFSKTNDKLNGLFGSGKRASESAGKKTGGNMSGPQGLDDLLNQFRQSS